MGAPLGDRVARVRRIGSCAPSFTRQAAAPTPRSTNARAASRDSAQSVPRVDQTVFGGRRSSRHRIHSRRVMGRASSSRVATGMRELTNSPSSVLNALPMCLGAPRSLGLVLRRAGSCRSGMRFPSVAKGETVLPNGWPRTLRTVPRVVIAVSRSRRSPEDPTGRSLPKATRPIRSPRRHAPNGAPGLGRERVLRRTRGILSHYEDRGLPPLRPPPPASP